MGDLKKKKVDYVAKTDDGEEILIESGVMATDKKTIDLLRTYMKKFYEMQLKKQNEQGEA